MNGIESGSGLDAADRKILNFIQGEFPISVEPFDEIGRAVGITGNEALKRIVGMMDRGVVRKIGPFFDAKKMHYTSTLCAAYVPEDKLGKVTGIINGYPEVTHNYLREGIPNVWFTVIAENNQEIDRIIEEISDKGGIGPVFNLPALKVFKIKVDLKIDAPK
ncbi:MAG: Lrp/AsnC family transcriptional regulator [Deltaproteobacteria bacterium]|nr:Lrp/AsnC family transcriptional regulator [Deltaproteobacteria bacterium]